MVDPEVLKRIVDAIPLPDGCVKEPITRNPHVTSVLRERPKRCEEQGRGGGSDER